MLGNLFNFQLKKENQDLKNGAKNDKNNKETAKELKKKEKELTKKEKEEKKAAVSERELEHHIYFKDISALAEQLFPGFATRLKTQNLYLEEFFYLWQLIVLD